MGKVKALPEHRTITSISFLNTEGEILESHKMTPREIELWNTESFVTLKLSEHLLDNTLYTFGDFIGDLTQDKETHIIPLKK